MQSLRYLRFKFCKNEKGSQAPPLSTLPNSFTRLKQKRHRRPLKAVSTADFPPVSPPVSTTPDTGTKSRRDSGASGKKTTQDSSRFNSVLYGHRNSYKLQPPPQKKIKKIKDRPENLIIPTRPPSFAPALPGMLSSSLTVRRKEF